jgi:hypothetical protein
MTDLITSVDPSFFLKKVNFDAISANYSAGKYNLVPTLTHVPNINNYIAHTIKKEDRPIGFRIDLPNLTVIIQGKETRYNLCCNDRNDYKGFCGFGIPIAMHKTEVDKRKIISFITEGETCSPECSYSLYKKFGNTKVHLGGKYVDSESLLKLMAYLLFGIELTEAPDITLLIPYGNTTLPDYRKHLHMLSEYVEPKLIKEEK